MKWFEPMKKAKRTVCLCIAMMLALGMSAWAAPAEETARNRYEMEIVLNETDRETPYLAMTVKATVINDSGDEWEEICFRDYMDSVYEWHAWTDMPVDEDGNPVDGAAEAEFSSGITSAAQGEKELNVRRVETHDPIACVTDESVIYVELDEPLPPGEAVTLTLTYEADIMEGQARCAYTSMIWDEAGARTYELAQFYPMLAVYEDGEWNESPYFTEGECFYTRCADYEITLNAPDKYQVIASGEETKRTSTDGMTVWRIGAENMRDVTIIVSNEYEVKTGEVCGVTVNSWHASNEKAQDGSDHEQQGAIQLQAAMDSVEAFTAAYGEYPYGELDVVESNYEFGGMEAPGLIRISQMYSWFIGEDDSEADRTEYREKCAGTVAHEVAHDWFYGVVGNDQYREAWLDESFAAFSEQVYWRHIGRIDGEIAAAMKPFMEHMPGSGDVTVDRTYGELNNERCFDYVPAVYQRGAGFLYQLEQSMGQEKFYEFMREYYAAFSMKEAHTEDFLNALAPYIEENAEAQALVKKYLSRAASMF